jgi:hypothetical protein
VETQAERGRVPLAGLSADVEPRAALGRVPRAGLDADVETGGLGRVALAGLDARMSRHSRRSAASPSPAGTPMSG